MVQTKQEEYQCPTGTFEYELLPGGETRQEIYCLECEWQMGQQNEVQVSLATILYGH